MEVKQLHECVYDKVGKTGRDNYYAQENLVLIYGMPFSYEMVEDVFGLNGDIVWKNYEQTKDKKKYTMHKEREEQDKVFLPMPRTIADFINDNDRYWKLPIQWDSNLVKRLFKL